MLQEQMTLPIGATVQDTYGERYRVDELLGQGGFGAVYLVRERHDRQRVFALKEIIDPSKHDRKSLLFECEVLKRLHHSALPRVYHAFEHDKLKRVYLLMEYIKGENLEILRRKQPEQRFSVDLAISIMTPIVNALIYLHQQDPPIVHRDIKPANIIVPLDGGEAVLVDFGTAKEYQPEKTTQSFRHGSPGYAALEQYGGGSGTDQRTDIYGLGATFYTLLTGVIPVDAITRVTTEKEHDPLKPVNVRVPAIPATVSRAIQRAMSNNKKERFASVEAFWDALRADPMAVSDPDTPILPAFTISNIEAVATTPLPIKQEGAGTKKRRLLIITLLILVVLGLGGGFIAFSLIHSGTISNTGAVATVTHASRPSPTSPLPDTAPYPPIAQAYAGTAGDLSVANSTTKMYLTNIQQDRGNIQGTFQGLGLSGPFTGTVTIGGALHFMVKTSAVNNNTTLMFDGYIKVGGDLTGTFNVVAQDGRSTGESGVWYARAAS